MSLFFRTCQECNNSQPATEPRGTPTCRRCHSPGLDYGHRASAQAGGWHRQGDRANSPPGWAQIDAGLEQTP